MSERTRTQEPPTVETPARSVRSIGSLGVAVVGALAVAAALLPGLFPVAWVLGAIAFVAGSRLLDRGADAPEDGAARLGRALGAAAVVIGVLNLGISLGWFNYFTAR